MEFVRFGRCSTTVLSISKCMEIIKKNIHILRKNVNTKIESHGSKIFLLCIVILLVLGTFLRFVNYSERWGLAYDQAYDAIVARYAYDNNKLPLLGRFSSGGPFQTGGEWYWLIMIGIAMYPDSIISPWVFITSLYVLFIFLIISFGKELVDKKFALILGTLTVFSTAQITQSTNLANQSPEAFFSLLSLWFSIRFLRSRNLKNLFLSALFVGICSSIHLQGAPLVILLAVTIIISKKINIHTLAVCILGVLIPWIPVLYVDIQNNFFNTKNLVQYYLHDQYKISLDVLGRRWLTYLGVFWIKSWSFITGGLFPFMYIFLPIGFIHLLQKIVKKKVSKEWATIIITFILLVSTLRYVRAPLFESYLVFLHPFVILLTAAFIYSIYKINFPIALTVLLVFIIGGIHSSYFDINKSTNKTIKQVTKLQNGLINSRVNEKYAVYDYKYSNSSISLPVVLSLYTDNLIDDTGLRIGLIDSSRQSSMTYPVIVDDVDGISIIKLNEKKHSDLLKEGWVFTNPSYVYKETQEWYKNEN